MFGLDFGLLELSFRFFLLLFLFFLLFAFLLDLLFLLGRFVLNDFDLVTAFHSCLLGSHLCATKAEPNEERCDANKSETTDDCSDDEGPVDVRRSF